MHDHRLDVDAVRKDALELGKILTAAQSVQWDASPVTSAFESVQGRSAEGGHAPDVVSSVALDERRLAVREAVRGAEGALTHIRASLAMHYTRVTRALEQWEGEDSAPPLAG